jgi:hypothetical protein
MGMNIFEYYGIKEVANVYFEALDDDKLNPDIKKGDIVLYLDTLKVSTVETTAENVSAQGGWGNPKLITWDYGKDINVTLEDAVVTFEELRIMLGAKLREAGKEDAEVIVHRSAECIYDGAALKPVKDDITLPEDQTNFKYINRTQGVRSIDGAKKSDRIIVFWEEKRVGGDEGQEAVELVISPDTFPGTYKVVGDALIRNKDGKDDAFQFVINKAKMLSEVTLTMQAEGDPSTFNMTLNVLRDDNGNMMSLIKY